MPQPQRRSRLILGLLALGLLAGVALTASPAQAVDAVGPYYALPSWDQKKLAANRFVVLTNWNSEAVLDKETGLVWEKSPNATLQSWTYARLNCATNPVGGRKGWRLPSMPELASLVDPANSNPALPTGHPFQAVQSYLYWSASTNAEFPTDAWFVNFSSGEVNGRPRTLFSHAWCVRGGMNADAY